MSIFKSLIEYFRPIRLTEFWYVKYKGDKTFDQRHKKAIRLINESDLKASTVKSIFESCGITVRISTNGKVDEKEIDKNKEVDACYKMPVYE